MKRENGYYWVDHQGYWMICYWENYKRGGGSWTCMGVETVYDESEFREIDERQIVRN